MAARRQRNTGGHSHPLTAPYVRYPPYRRQSGTFRRSEIGQRSTFSQTLQKASCVTHAHVPARHLKQSYTCAGMCVRVHDGRQWMHAVVVALKKKGHRAESNSRRDDSVSLVQGYGFDDPMRRPHSMASGWWWCEPLHMCSFPLARSAGCSDGVWRAAEGLQCRVCASSKHRALTL